MAVVRSSVRPASRRRDERKRRSARGASRTSTNSDARQICLRDFGRWVVRLPRPGVVGLTQPNASRQWGILKNAGVMQSPRRLLDVPTGFRCRTTVSGNGSFRPDRRVLAQTHSARSSSTAGAHWNTSSSSRKGSGPPTVLTRDHTIPARQNPNPSGQHRPQPASVFPASHWQCRGGRIPPALQKWHLRRLPSTIRTNGDSAEGENSAQLQHRAWATPGAVARHDGTGAATSQLPLSVEHTPVSGKTSSTLRAASQSPARPATIDRTCS
jgi:hypothetical protein